MLRSRFGSFRFTGPYPSWEAAMQDSRGYAAGDILERVKRATEAVVRGEAAFERDSLTFDRIQYAWPVLASLLWIALCRGGRLRVLDYGGALGSSYRQNLRFLSNLEALSWTVVEQPHFVACGREQFSDGILRFCADFSEAFSPEPPDVAFFSSVLHYLPDPYAPLTEIRERGVEYILIDRTPFLEGPEDRIYLQRTSRRIYPATYPARFLSRERFLRFFEQGYRLVEEFNSLDKSNVHSRYLGFLFRRADAAGD